MRNGLLNNEKKLYRLIQVKFACLIVLAFVAAFLLNREEDAHMKYGKAGEIRYTSYVLADQLRQSSDDLTRMVRSYAVTSNEMFEKYFGDIVAIREGGKARPRHYERAYWDFMTVESPLPPFGDGERKPLLRLMEEAGFTEEEFRLLTEAQKRSDVLIGLETRAMKAMKGKFPDGLGGFSRRGEPDRQLAVQLLFGKQYHEAKRNIMGPINAFLKAMDQRTSGLVSRAETRMNHYQGKLVAVFCAFVLIWLLLLLSAYTWHGLITGKLHEEIAVRGNAEEALRLARDELEVKVVERTAELLSANRELKAEIDERRRVEDALTVSEARFRSLSDASFEGIILSEKGAIIEANSTMGLLTGYTVVELTRMSVIDLVVPELRDNVREKVRSGYENSYETKGLRKDGSVFPVEVHAGMFSHKGRELRVTAVRDISERKRAEEEIRMLQGILPLCSFCKKIRDDKGYWEQVDVYLRKHSQADISHGVCPECMTKHYGDL